MGFGCVLFARSLDLDYGAALVGGIVYAFAGSVRGSHVAAASPLGARLDALPVLGEP